MTRGGRERTTVHVRAGLAVLALALSRLCSAGEIERETSRLPDVEPPPRGTAEWVAPSMRMNGVPMTIKRFTTALALDDVFHFYESWQRGRGLATLQRQAMGEWELLSVNTGEYHITIQARAQRQGSEGTITVSADLSRARASSTTQFPHPPSATVASLQEYEDAGILAEHIDFVSQRPLGNEAVEFRSRLLREGWEIVLDGEGASSPDAYVIEAQRGAELARIVLQPGRAVGATTSIVAIWRKS